MKYFIDQGQKKKNLIISTREDEAIGIATGFALSKLRPKGAKIKNKTANSAGMNDGNENKICKQTMAGKICFCQGL